MRYMLVIFTGYSSLKWRFCFLLNIFPDSANSFKYKTLYILAINGAVFIAVYFSGNLTKALLSVTLGCLIQVLMTARPGAFLIQAVDKIVLKINNQ